jgi:hypothetical protein
MHKDLQAAQSAFALASDSVTAAGYAAVYDKIVKTASSS